MSNTEPQMPSTPKRKIIFEEELEDVFSPDTAIVKMEKFDIDMATWISQTQEISSEEKRRIKSMLKHKTLGNQFEAKYVLGKQAKHEFLGRWIVKGSIGLQGLSRDLRNALAKDYYWDLDFNNCQVEIMRQMAIQRGWVHDKLDEYCSNRDAIFSKIKESHDLDRDEIKQMFIRILFGGNRITSHPKWINEEFYPEVLSIMKNVASLNPDLLKKCKKSKPENPVGSCCAQILQTEERKCLMALDSILGKNDRNLAVYIHDGGYVEKLKGEREFPLKLLTICSEYVRQKTGYDLVLSIKKIETSFDISNKDETPGKFNTDYDSTNTAFEIMGDTVKITYEKGDERYGYIWNPTTLLWEGKLRETIEAHIMDGLIADIKADIENAQGKSSIPFLEMALKKVKGSGGRTSIFKLCIAKFLDLEFKEKINPLNTEFLPLHNGMIYSMKTQELRKRIITDLYSEELECSITSSTERVAEYYNELFNGDWKRANKILGYCWTPLNNLKQCFIFIGDRDTGKSTLIRMTSGNMGNRFKPLSEQVIFEHKKNGNHTDELVYALQGTTLSVSSETKHGQVLNESVIKQIVGNDCLALRECAGRSVSLTPVTKLIISCNIQPAISSDPTFIPKLMYLNFPHQFEVSDISKTKVRILENDREFLDQLFTLQMKGAYEYYNNQCVDDDIKTKELYLGKQPVDMWLEECYDIGTDTDRISSVIALSDFLIWVKRCDSNIKIREDEFRIIMKKKFTLKQGKINKKNMSCYFGLKLKIEDESEE